MVRALLLPSVHLEPHTFEGAARELRAMDVYDIVERPYCATKEREETREIIQQIPL